MPTPILPPLLDYFQAHSMKQAHHQANQHNGISFKPPTPPLLPRTSQWAKQELSQTSNTERRITNDIVLHLNESSSDDPITGYHKVGIVYQKTNTNDHDLQSPKPSHRVGYKPITILIY